MRNTTTVFTQSPEETHSFGVELARDLEPQTVIALIGDLGSGKTCLTQGICAGLEVEEYVTSPTFTLINEYRGRLPVYHFDLYRIDDLKEMLDLGYEEYFYGNGVCVIEWAEKMETLLPEKRIEILLKRIGENEREFRITHFTEHTRE
ncbi:MAG: tRNA (adenosine(37)-N6)-threonylcarbamoyltransferase complex ATPase subunit type 1 TsaE [Gemmatimonadota bacterium]|nr:MAG: tRNA (adenosine(37)-N6)-threonylcarbamoyltransferase complex ATPase subunit type 1 TsaE [Gemmatimonadota bacterium]